MASPIDRLRQGIVEENWEIVQEAFTALTGEVAVARPQTKKLAKPRPKAKAAKLEPQPEPQPQRSRTAVPDFTIQHGQPKNESGRSMARVEPIDTSPMENLFKDDGKAAAVDKQFDRKVVPAEPSERRESPTLVTVKCEQCHRETELPPELAPHGLGADDDGVFEYLCDRCIGGMR
jgi:hypothetical protein